jgi:molybdopterin-guanine dinucleotide biosynthesis protein A
MKITGLVLAGGYSQRMGTDKSALLLNDGRTLVQRQVDVLQQSGITDVLVARRRDQTAAQVPARTVFDIAIESGPMAGVAAGLATIRDGMLFMIAVDMPYVTTTVVRQMMALSSQGRGVIPHRGKSIECLIGVYPRELASAATARVAAGRLRVREFAALAEGMGLAMRWEIPQRLLSEFRNWNTPEDVTK